MEQNVKTSGQLLRTPERVQLTLIKSVYGSRLGCFYRFFALMALMLVIIFYSLTSCTRADNKFYKQVLSDFDSSAYFIALNVKSPEYRGRVIIKNNNLYGFLHEGKGLSKTKYMSYMTRILSHNRSMRIKDRDFLKWKFIRVTEVESVDLVANEGRDKFVDHFFNGVVLNYGIPEEERNSIINQLFFWSIPARFDQLTGDLMIG